MTHQTYYYPFIQCSGRVCGFSKEQAQSRIEREKIGELIEVPSFETEEEAEKWIKKQANSKDWDISFFDEMSYDPKVIYCVIRDRLQ